MNKIGIHLIHIILFGGLFLYVGITGINIPRFMYPILLALGVIIILYHTFAVYKKLQNEKNPWVNVIHIFFIAPILIYIGAIKEQSQRHYFEILLLLGFASIGYHSYYMITIK